MKEAEKFLEKENIENTTYQITTVRGDTGTITARREKLSEILNRFASEQKKKEAIQFHWYKEGYRGGRKFRDKIEDDYNKYKTTMAVYKYKEQ